MPTAFGTYTFTVTVTDTPQFAGPNAPQATDQKVLQVDILGPTAAGVTIGGTVRGFAGNALRGATVAIIDLNSDSGSLQKVSTDRDGRFQFDGIEAGRYYLIKVFHKRYQFVDRFVFVGNDLDSLDFIGQLGESPVPNAVNP